MIIPKVKEQLNNETVPAGEPELMEAESGVVELTAGADDAGARLDAFIGWNTDELSRSYAVKLIEKGRVMVNGKVAKSKKTAISEGDTVTKRHGRASGSGQLVGNACKCGDASLRRVAFHDQRSDPAGHSPQNRQGYQRTSDDRQE